MSQNNPPGTTGDPAGTGPEMTNTNLPTGVAPGEATARRPGRPEVPRTRAGQTWAALTIGMVLLVVVLVFILQNLKSVRVHFLWVTWTIPLAVDLLLATVLGALIMFTAGSLRILQLRRLAKRNARDAAVHRDAAPVG